MITMKMGKTVKEVKDIAEAVSVWDKIRDSILRESGDTNIPWPRLIKDGKVFAHISWNSRVWEGGNFGAMNKKEIVY